MDGEAVGRAIRVVSLQNGSCGPRKAKGKEAGAPRLGGAQVINRFESETRSPG